MRKMYAQMMSGEVKGGQATTEYVVIIALLVLAAAFALFNFRDELIQLWTHAEDVLVAVATEGEPAAYVEAVDNVRA